MARERASPCHFWFSNPEGVEVTISSESVCKDRRQATSYDGTAAWIPITAKRRIPSTALQRAGSDDDAREGSPTGFQWGPRHGGPWLARQCQGHVLSAHHTCTGSLSFNWSFFCHQSALAGTELAAIMRSFLEDSCPIHPQRTPAVTVSHRSFSAGLLGPFFTGN